MINYIGSSAYIKWKPTATDILVDKVLNEEACLQTELRGLQTAPETTVRYKQVKMLSGVHTELVLHVKHHEAKWTLHILRTSLLHNLN